MAMDPDSFYAAIAVVTIPIALLVGSVHLLSYIKENRLASLLQSISFFLLVIASVISIMVDFYKEGFDYTVEYDLVLIGAISLMVISYVQDARAGPIKLRLVQKSLIAFSFALPVLYSFYLYFDVPFSMFQYFGLMPLSQYVLIYLPMGMIVAVVSLMYSFRRPDSNRTRLFGMAGFVLILLGMAFYAINSLTVRSTMIQFSQFLMVLGLFGYAANLFVSIVLYRSSALPVAG